MNHFIILISTISLLSQISSSLQDEETDTLPYTVIYKWKFLDFALPPEMNNANYFIPKNNVVGELKVFGNYLYIPVPRFYKGVPFTLTRAPYDPIATKNVIGYKLEPYPNLAMQEMRNCAALQNVVTMEIDLYGRLWIVDSGRTLSLDDIPDTTCPPKLVIMDTKTDGVIYTHVFPADVVPYNTSLLSSIVVACTCIEKCAAFMPSTLNNQITIFDYAMKKSWSVYHSTMKANPAYQTFTILGKSYTFPFGVDGIAISPRDELFSKIYYASVAGITLYSVKRSHLYARGTNGLVNLEDSDIENVGNGKAQCDGLTVDAGGNMYYARLTENALITWNTTDQLNSAKERVYAQSNTKLEWVDSLCFDNRGNLIFTSDKFNLFFVGKGYRNGSDYNIRIMRIKSVKKNFSYMYPAR